MAVSLPGSISVALSPKITPIIFQQRVVGATRIEVSMPESTHQGQVFLNHQLGHFVPFTPFSTAGQTGGRRGQKSEPRHQIFQLGGIRIAADGGAVPITPMRLFWWQQQLPRAAPITPV